MRTMISNWSLRKTVARIENSPGLNRKQYYTVYTIVFAVTAFLAYFVFFLNGKSFIFQVDGWAQHLRALLYYSRWLRSIVRSLLSGVLEIPTYSFSLGEGADVLQTLHYYVVGDPLTLFSVFVPADYMAYFYSALIILRLYLAGIAFSVFVFSVNRGETAREMPRNMAAVLAGSLSYVFCGFALYGGIRHPYFLNPMIYLPLVLLGADRILNKKSPYLFILSVTLSAVSNFYFFYMIAILTVLFVLWRMFFFYGYRDCKRILLVLLKYAGYAILAVLMSAVIFLPAVLGFSNSSRVDLGTTIELLYSMDTYERAIGGFLSIAASDFGYAKMGYAVIVLLAAILLFSQRGSKDFKVAFVVLTSMILLPAAGSLMNGFSYATNRWIWGYGFLLSWIVVEKWQDLLSMTRREAGVLLGILLLYLGICFLVSRNRTVDIIFAAALALGTLALIVLFHQTVYKKSLQLILIVSIVANITINATFQFSAQNAGYMKQFLPYDGLMEQLTRTGAQAIDAVSEEDAAFFRHVDVNAARNSIFTSGQHGIQFFWSLENGNISDFRREMAFSEDRIQSYNSVDSRTFVSTLANVKYYIQDEGLPFGYEHIASIANYPDTESYLREKLGNEYSLEDLSPEERDTLLKQTATYHNLDKVLTYQVWENKYALPFGYTYSGYIAEEDYLEMNPLEKQEALLQGCVVSGNAAQGIKIAPRLTGTEIPYTVSAGDGITVEDGQIIVKDIYATVTLTFEGLPNAETYLYWEGIQFDQTSPLDSYSDLQLKLLSDLERNEVYRAQKKYYESANVEISLTTENSKGTITTTPLTYRTPANTWYCGWEEYLINLGFDEQAKTSVTIQLPVAGTYSFDAMKIFCQPMDNYPEQVAALKETTLENADFHIGSQSYTTNHVSGSIHLDEAKYLLLTIPYGKGWAAYVNGEPQELLRANRMYSALYLEPGEYTIDLVYATPGLNIGIMLSAASIAFFLFLVVFRKRRKMDL